jgi:tetratricopeptide (TPR) repeat protein
MASRAVPSVSNFVLAASASYRQKGTEAFKRGDYGEAQTHYTSALSGLPSTHPITIIILCNRALTNIKTGDPKAAIVDADAAIKTIGPGRGDEESISLGESEGEKPMKEFYGKALMRKAEAYEHMEKWSEAAAVWRVAVEAGVGGSVSIQGRNRCEKAAGPSSSTAASNVVGRTSVAAKRVPTPAQPARGAKPASAALSMNGGQESDAVKRLRAANAAAVAASDEAFALNDAVEARLNAWKQGKEGNLRALLGSLDTILWTEADWKKIGMSDLVMPNKVKINYMKAIAKVHPDKVC